MSAATSVYSVLPDFEVGGRLGSDALDWIETDDEAVNMEQARLHEAIADFGPLPTPWIPYPAVYVQAGRTAITASFFDYGSFLAAKAATKARLAEIPDFEWLALDPVENTPAGMVVPVEPSFYVMRFWRKVVPHPKSRFTYFPGTRAIDEVLSLALEEESARDLYAFRLEGDSVTHYVTERMVELCRREGLRGLEFTEVPSG